MTLNRLGPLLMVASCPLWAACRAPDPGTERAPTRSQLVCESCNVVLVSIDTLRPDHLDAYGYHRATAPKLKRLADEEAVLFEDAVNSGGGTLPVHMSLMTSLNPLAHNVWEQNVRELDEGRVTLAEHFRDQGFTTAAFTDGGYVRSVFGFGHGFDVFDDEAGGFEAILPKARRWVAEHARERFFLFLHTYDVHSKWGAQPYGCEGYDDLFTEGYDGDFTGCIDGVCASNLFQSLNDRAREDPAFRIGDHVTSQDLEFVRARYDSCIRYVDDQLDGFFAELRERGLWDRTLVVITSDHGEEFLEHGLLLHQNPYFDTNMRIPLIMKLPQGALGGRRVAHLASTLDIFPTLADMVGTPIPEQAQGASLLPALAEDRSVRDMATVFAAVRTPRWKMVPRSAQSLLFDLAADPGEQSDMARARPELVEALREAGRNAKHRDEQLYEAFASGGTPTEELELSPEHLEELRALGYIP